MFDSVHRDFPGKNTGVGCHALLQEIFPTKEWNPQLLGLLHCKAGSLPLVPPGKPLMQCTYIKISQSGTIRCAYIYVSSEKAMAPDSSTLAWKIHGRRSLLGCSPWGREESDTTEQLHFHFSLSCIGEENGNPLQCSCLENPRDGGAWWAAVFGVAQSRTRLKRLSSNSSM